MFVDKVKILIKAGDGGNGVVSFLRSKLTMNGGPDGGNGGKGADVIFVADANQNNLASFYYEKKYVAENGCNGEANNRAGKKGNDLIIKVPKGTVIKDAISGKIIADIFYDDDRVVVLKGGRGGRGNATFATSTRQAPNFSQSGEKTKAFEVILELKTIADVGLIGFPNVGKSHLISIMTNAKPKIANYAFTTLVPNLGVCIKDDFRFVIADIPGIIEGASTGKGLGLQFLRHIERTRLFVHVIDITGFENRNPLEDFEIINKELFSYSEKLKNITQIIALNKTDLLFENNNVDEFVKKYGKKYKIVTTSAATTKGVEELKNTIIAELKKLPPATPERVEVYEIDKIDNDEYTIIQLDSNYFEISGSFIDNLIRGIIVSDPESLAYFQKRLKNKGVFDKLKEMGARDGDTVKVADIEFDYYE